MECTRGSAVESGADQRAGSRADQIGTDVVESGGERAARAEFQARDRAFAEITGDSADPDHAYQQRTFLRRYGTPWETIYLEDETRAGASAALRVDQSDSTGGDLYNQSGPGKGTLGPGTYELQYELHNRPAWVGIPLHYLARPVRP